MRGWRVVRFLAGILIVGGLTAVALWPEPVEVDVVPAERGPMRVTIDEDGETRVRDRFVVAAPVSGRLQRIVLEPGDAVTIADVVARIAPADAPLLDPRMRAELQAAVAAAAEVVGQARMERDRASAARDRAAATAERFAALVEAGAVSREDFESAQTTVTTTSAVLRGAAFALARAEHELDQARARLQQPAAAGRLIEIRSPAAGVVLKRLRESECVVAAGEPLLEIGDPRRLEVVADLLSTDAVRVRSGSRATIERWGGREPLPAHVRLVEPSGFLKVSALGVEEQRVNVILDFDDPARAGRKLGDAYRVDARIIVWESKDVLSVPAGSLFRRGDEWAVFVVDGTRARLTPIEIGQRNFESAEVLGGIGGDARVVLHPPDTLVDGARIRERIP